MRTREDRPRSLASVRWFFRSPAVISRHPLSARRLSRRRSKRAVLSGLAVFLLATLGFNVALDTVKPEWRDPEYGHRLKELKPLARSAGDRPLVVALGSSRSQMGLNPAEMELDDRAVVYNLSQAGCGPVHELMNLQRLLAEGIRPDFLLVEILPPVLGGTGPADHQFIPARLGFADLARIEPYCSDESDLWADWLKARAAPWYSLRLYHLSHWGLGSWLPWQARQDFMWKQMRGRGWLPYFFTEMQPGRREDGLARARNQYVPYFPNFAIAPLPDRAYRDLVELCRSRGIKVAFYTMPESPIFRSWYPHEVRTKINAYYDGWRAKGVQVFDASGWLDDEGHFADGHHLMRPGSQAFSRRFAAECLAPWIEKAPRQ